ncbi:T. brucei spp.-specific protein [Trypanosoma brucei gambiense DAL972]|uniref:T. brucei spp.-specific protein n=1 Tax=Trypanosoma brucei gambiense (strain MHOM/CI/86/DAL972) TaxID=679716 RepID=C9ZQE4_TRYB9|nr:T. brucei spp.-specific protein [Trypanosoma brucei gambiense DAL972]CBH11624.1 T. brucei spp.-specific protein [Trypanosoma brucei gambiense DAL972]|eukprot:XP_011773909.1 T. brucei spp.-specific protein [Trypanosoma brucei gambiense DAL972]
MVTFTCGVTLLLFSFHFFAIQSEAIPHICVNAANYSHTQFEECLTHMCDLSEELSAFKRTAVSLKRQATGDAETSKLALQYMEEALEKVLHVTQGVKEGNKTIGTAAAVKKSVIEAKIASDIADEEASKVERKLDKATRDAGNAEKNLQRILIYTARKACSSEGISSQDEEVKEAQCNVSTEIVYSCTRRPLKIKSDTLRKTYERLKSFTRTPNKTINEHLPKCHMWTELLEPAVASLTDMEKSASVARAYRNQVIKARGEAQQAAWTVGVTVQDVDGLDEVSEEDDFALAPVVLVAVLIVGAVLIDQHP